jgi:hypothetical protein
MNIQKAAYRNIWYSENRNMASALMMSVSPSGQERCLGTKAREYLAYYDKCWTEEPYTGGCPVGNYAVCNGYLSTRAWLSRPSQRPHLLLGFSSIPLPHPPWAAAAPCPIMIRTVALSQVGSFSVAAATLRKPHGPIFFAGTGVLLVLTALQRQIGTRSRCGRFPIRDGHGLVGIHGGRCPIGRARRGRSTCQPEPIIRFHGLG